MFPSLRSKLISKPSSTFARASPLKFFREGLIPLLAIACTFSAAGQQASNTTTALTLTAAGVPVSSVLVGTVVTLTATVTANGLSITPGLVNFCDAAPAHCTDIHLLGTAQLTSAGVAAFKFIPGVGSHSYQAIFVGTATRSEAQRPRSLLPSLPLAQHPPQPPSRPAVFLATTLSQQPSPEV
jgi:hypothetical protein